MNHQAQTRNNCGPASVAIIMGYYDHWITQETVNELLNPFPSPCGIIFYIREQFGQFVDERNHYGDDPAVNAHLYHLPIHKDSDKILPVKLLLANGIAVIVFQELSLDSDIGHYRILRGYDDASREFIVDDPLLGPDHRIPYDTFVELIYPWRSARAIIPVFPPEKESLVKYMMEGLGMRRAYCRSEFDRW